MLTTLTRAYMLWCCEFETKVMLFNLSLKPSGASFLAASHAFVLNIQPSLQYS